VLHGLEHVLDLLLNALRLHDQDNSDVELLGRSAESLDVVSALRCVAVDDGARGKGLGEGRSDQRGNIFEVLFFLGWLDFFFVLLFDELVGLLEEDEIVVEFCVHGFGKLTYLFLVEIVGDHLAVRVEAGDGGTILALESTKNVTSDKRGGWGHDTSRNRPRWGDIIRL